MFKLGAISCAFQHVITVVNFESHNVQAITLLNAEGARGLINHAKRFSVPLHLHIVRWINGKDKGGKEIVHAKTLYK